MINFDDLIEYENENTRLDFKTKQYKKNKYGSDNFEDLIKDIISMANANIESDRYIIIGVKHKPSSERKIIGIQNEEFIDSATYEQIINENVEPDIKIEYTAYKYKNKLLDILKIYDCFDDQPYSMKKDFRKLKKGNSFIRKGTHTSVMLRKDYDIIYERKLKKEKFNGKVKLWFSGYDSRKEIELSTAGNIELPSDRAAKKIKKVIKQKRGSYKRKSKNDIFPNLSKILEKQNRIIESVSMGLGPTSYENRSVEELQKNLKEIKQTYCEDDIYWLLEANAHKINVSILNEGYSYIEDASIQLNIKKIEGLFIADRVYKKPTNGVSKIINSHVPSLEFLDYPEVNDSNSIIIIYQTIGDVKHFLPLKCFKIPIRVLLLNCSAGKSVEIKCKIFGKNLINPLTENLKIKAVLQDKNKN